MFVYIPEGNIEWCQVFFSQCAARMQFSYCARWGTPRRTVWHFERFAHGILTVRCVFSKQLLDMIGSFLDQTDVYKLTCACTCIINPLTFFPPQEQDKAQREQFGATLGRKLGWDRFMDGPRRVGSLPELATQSLKRKSLGQVIGNRSGPRESTRKPQDVQMGGFPRSFR